MHDAAHHHLRRAVSEGLDILELALDEEFGKEIRSTTNVHDISTAIRARS